MSCCLCCVLRLLCLCDPRGLRCHSSPLRLCCLCCVLRLLCLCDPACLCGLCSPLCLCCLCCIVHFCNLHSCKFCIDLFPCCLRRVLCRYLGAAVRHLGRQHLHAAQRR